MTRLLGWLFVSMIALGCDANAALEDAGGEDARGPDASDETPCARDLDCTDDVFCNGAERCMPGAAGAAANGCVAGNAPCTASERCDEAGARCEAMPCEGTAANGCPNADFDCDGDRRVECGGGADCDDTTAARSSLNAEVCDPDGVDEDCNLSTVYDVVNNDGDVDDDGYISVSCFNLGPDATEMNRGDDCDDSMGGVHPDADEYCNGIDDDCDAGDPIDPTLIDEPDAVDAQVFYQDLDRDTYGNLVVTKPGCPGNPPTDPGPTPTDPYVYVLRPGDCWDTNVPAAAAVNPGITAYSDRPYCREATMPCPVQCASTRRWLCAARAVGGACTDPDIPVTSCTGRPGSFDFNCTGAAELFNVDGACRFDAAADTCTLTQGATGAPTASDCGRDDWPHAYSCSRGGASCYFGTRPGTLWCR